MLLTVRRDSSESDYSAKLVSASLRSGILAVIASSRQRDARALMASITRRELSTVTTHASNIKLPRPWPSTAPHFVLALAFAFAFFSASALLMRARLLRVWVRIVAKGLEAKAGLARTAGRRADSSVLQEREESAQAVKLHRGQEDRSKTHSTLFRFLTVSFGCPFPPSSFHDPFACPWSISSSSACALSSSACAVTCCSTSSTSLKPVTRFSEGRAARFMRRVWDFE
jgi:hypothetical protein